MSLNYSEQPIIESPPPMKKQQQIDEEVMMDEESRPWLDLPIDILDLIASRVPPSAQPSFSSVCKRWCQCGSRVYPIGTCPLLLHFEKKKTRGKDETVFYSYFYSPFYHISFKVKWPIYHSTKFLFAKNGWLLLARDQNNIFVFNPFSGSRRSIPPLKKPLGMDGFAFAGHPYSPVFMIFHISFNYSFLPQMSQMSLFHRGEWSPLHQYEDFDFCHANPVYYGGCFCCLGVKGDLGFFNPRDNTWYIIAPLLRLRFGTDKVFLVESNGELLSVLISKRKGPIHVYRFDLKSVNWERVNDLGNRMLFVGDPMSHAMIAPVKAMENKIYTQWFRGHPEIVEARVKGSNSEAYFVSSTMEGQDKRESTEDIICCTLGEPSDKMDDNFQYLSSIWFQPSFK